MLKMKKLPPDSLNLLDLLLTLLPITYSSNGNIDTAFKMEMWLTHSYAMMRDLVDAFSTRMLKEKFAILMVLVPEVNNQVGKGYPMHGYVFPGKY